MGGSFGTESSKSTQSFVSLGRKMCIFRGSHIEIVSRKFALYKKKLRKSWGF